MQIFAVVWCCRQVLIHVFSYHLHLTVSQKEQSGGNVVNLEELILCSTFSGSHSEDGLLSWHKVHASMY